VENIKKLSSAASQSNKQLELTQKEKSQLEIKVIQLEAHNKKLQQTVEANSNNNLGGLSHSLS
jgi:cell division protein FtsB